MFSCFLLLGVINLYGQLPNTLSASDKVYGLSKFWQEVNYNFVYLNKVDRGMWENSYKELITKVQATTNDYEYYRELQKFCALLKDGHTNVMLPKVKVMEQMTTMFGDYRLFLENIDDKAIIVRTNLSKKNEIPIGSEIIEVNGIPTKKYIAENVAPYISSSTEYVLKDMSVNRLLQGLEGDKYQIKIKPKKGDVITLNLTHAITKEEGVYPAFENKRELVEFKWLTNQIAYVGLNSFNDVEAYNQFKKLLPELYKAKAMVIDLRYNGGGNTDIGAGILQYLVKDNQLYGSRSSSRLHIPTFKAWGQFQKPSDTVNNEWAKKAFLSYHDDYFYQFEYKPETIEIEDKRIVVPTAILIGHNTASAAEDFLIYADKQSHMIKIGENTFGSTGQPFLFDLPGGGSARICTKKDTYPDGREFVGYGIKPDIEVKRTLETFQQGKDRVLDKSVEYLKSEMK
jgi:C-terminal processing protease CtpA/Prc